MGVTLERVQFKFASIIGELCSEPDVLSQFAVWVDLRLAEYKLKGSISLDCSGETPDPMWLKGILSALLAKRLSQKTSDKLTSRGLAGNHGHSSLALQSAAIRNRTSVHGRIETPDSDVYPIGFHVHKSPGVSISQQDNRKRRASEILPRSEYAIPQDAGKLRRLGNMEADSGTLPTESLMSIINAGEGLDSSTGNSENSKTDENIKTETQLAESSQPDITCSAEDTGQSNEAESRVSETGALSLSASQAGRLVAAEVDEVLQASLMYMYAGVGPDSSPSSLNSSHNSATYRNVPRIAANPPKETSQYVKNASSAVSIFGRWFRRKSPADARRIEEIPPEELDDLLADFFSTIKKKDGGDYYPRSLHLLRTCLESHLKKAGYPVSITKSVFFNKSSHAFRTRKCQLELAQNSPSMKFSL